MKIIVVKAKHGKGEIIEVIPRKVFKGKRVMYKNKYYTYDRFFDIFPKADRLYAKYFGTDKIIII